MESSFPGHAPSELDKIRHRMAGGKPSDVLPTSDDSLAKQLKPFPDGAEALEIEKVAQANRERREASRKAAAEAARAAADNAPQGDANKDALLE